MSFDFNRDKESRLKILKAIAPLNTFTHPEVLELVAIQEKVSPNTLEAQWLMQIIFEARLVEYNREKSEFKISAIGSQFLEEDIDTTDLNWEETVDLWAVTYYGQLMDQFSMSEKTDTQQLIYNRAENNLKFHQNRLRQQK